MGQLRKTRLSKKMVSRVKILNGKIANLWTNFKDKVRRNGIPMDTDDHYTRDVIRLNDAVIVGLGPYQVIYSGNAYKTAFVRADGQEPLLVVRPSKHKEITAFRKEVTRNEKNGKNKPKNSGNKSKNWVYDY